MSMNLTLKDNKSSPVSHNEPFAERQMRKLTVIWRQGFCHVLGCCGLEEEEEEEVLLKLLLAAESKFKCQVVKWRRTSVGAGLLDSIVCG